MIIIKLPNQRGSHLSKVGNLQLINEAKFLIAINVHFVCLDLLASSIALKGKHIRSCKWKPRNSLICKMKSMIITIQITILITRRWWTTCSTLAYPLNVTSSTNDLSHIWVPGNENNNKIDKTKTSSMTLKGKYKRSCKWKPHNSLTCNKMKDIYMIITI